MRRPARRGLGSAVAAASLVLVVACGGPPQPRGEALQRVLDRQAAAVLDRDPDAYLRTIDPRATAYRERQRRVFHGLSQLPLAQWSYRVLRSATPDPRRAGVEGRRIVVRVQLRYRLRGYDHAARSVRDRLTFTARHGHWYLSAPAGAASTRREGARPPWAREDLTVVRGEHSLVIGMGADRARVRTLARTADRAVLAVRARWPYAWDGRVVVEAPASLERMATLLGGSVASYRGVAAVTVGAAGRSPLVPADRIVVNPEAYGDLPQRSQQVVLTHETTHVATRTRTSSATPLWLSEGFADWVGHHDSGRDPGQIAPTLARTVRGGGAPRSLPTDGEFRLGGDAERLGRAYEGGWLACQLIAHRWGADRLVAFYAAVGDAGRRQRRTEVVDRALREVLRVTPAEFTARWRTYLERTVGR